MRKQDDILENLIINFLGLTSLGSSACGQHAVTSTWVGVLFSAEQLKDMHQIVMYIS